MSIYRLKDKVKDRLNISDTTVKTLLKIERRVEKETEKENAERVGCKVNSNAAMEVHYRNRATEIKSIPGFWGIVFSKYAKLADFITPQDRKILKHLSMFEVEVDPKNELKYSFEFGFDENGYFSTQSIKKSYQPPKSYQSTSSARVDRQIKWKKGMRPNGVAEGNTRNWNVYENISFFTWFCWGEDPDEKIGITLKDFIWPDAWTLYKAGVPEEKELGLSTEIIRKMNSIQVNIDELIKKERQDIQKIERDFRLSMAKIYQERDAVTKDIPNFWLKVFLSHHYFGSRLNKNDIEIKKYLTSLEVKDPQIEDGGDDDGVFAKHSIMFPFTKNNPYFAEERLEKTFFFNDELELLKRRATNITLKSGMSLDEVREHPESRGESTVTEQSTSNHSFYRWFSSANDFYDVIIEDEVSELIMKEIIQTPMRIIGDAPNEAKIPVCSPGAPNKRDAVVDNSDEANPSKRGRLT